MRSSSCTWRSRPARRAAPPSITSASQCQTYRRWRLSWQARDISKPPGGSRSRASHHQRHRARRQCMERFAYFLGPDGVKIELVTSDQKDATPIVAQHIHFINKQYVEMQQWYMK